MVSFNLLLNCALTLVKDDDLEVFQEPAKKPKTFTKPYVEVPEPSNMNFVGRRESKRVPPPSEISEKYKSLDAKLLQMKKKNRCMEVSPRALFSNETR